MIGIGTDIVEIRRVKRVWERQGTRFAMRILTATELARMEAKSEPWRFLAKRFSAKEAIAKAFGCGIGASLRWHDIDIASVASGRPIVNLSDSARSLAQDLGGREVLLSISDEREYAVAFAALIP
ncbi:MAG: holo-ACP synthase [Pseudomonadota bacterium]